MTERDRLRQGYGASAEASAKAEGAKGSTWVQSSMRQHG